MQFVFKLRPLVLPKLSKVPFPPSASKARTLYSKPRLDEMNASCTVVQELNTNPLKTAPVKKVIQLEETSVKHFAEKGAQILSSGGVIAVPTDTVYGIAANAQNDEAICRIYQIKGRDFGKPIAICVSSIDEVYQWGKVEVPKSLLLDLLPGSVTLVFERQPELNPNLNPGTNLIGIRIPNNKFIISLAKYHNQPIALTSANFSSSPSTLEVNEFQDLWPLLDFVFDGGRLSSCESTEKAARAGSTVIDLSRRGYYHIIREGTVEAECVRILQNKYKLKKDVRNNCA